ncbi:MAG TPA: class I SAM-dependent methyltransferase [Mycobacteriales bacterium]|nr:class I SAM-dependent methyltransferase [Mycobacteriales bacterium]
MLPITEKLLGRLAAFNTAHPWSHNAHYHGWILRNRPARVDRALDIGCGTGELARQLTDRAGEVCGIDADPAILDHARGLTGPALPVTYVAGDALTAIPPGPYDVITCVAALHHLPLRAALECFRENLAPGGTLLVVGLARDDAAIDHVLSAIAAPVNMAIGWHKNRGQPAPAPAMTPRVRPPTMSFDEIAREVGEILPGARLRRRLFWRYTLLWRRS